MGAAVPVRHKSLQILQAKSCWHSFSLPDYLLALFGNTWVDEFRMSDNLNLAPQYIVYAWLHS